MITITKETGADQDFVWSDGGCGHFGFYGKECYARALYTLLNSPRIRALHGEQHYGTLWDTFYWAERNHTGLHLEEKETGVDYRALFDVYQQCGLQELYEHHGDCIAHTWHTNMKSMHTIAIVDGKLYDDCDTRHMLKLTDSVWTPKFRF